MHATSPSTVLLTGATGGIGQAIAHTFARTGARLAISGTRHDALSALQIALKKEGAADVLILPASLGEDGTPQQLVESTEKHFGHLDVLIANAGITRDALLMRMSDDDWDQVLLINLRAIFQMCRAAIRGMIKRRTGRIINIASVVGVTGNAGQTNYTASKGGLISFTKSLALEVASRGITANAIAPGFIRTPMTSSMSEPAQEKILSTIPMGRMGTPEDIASGALFLASEGARYITGQTLHINGGLTMP
jgi:3-oxoacyl-[acyl-carrier protein] reductase